MINFTIILKQNKLIIFAHVTGKIDNNKDQVLHILLVRLFISILEFATKIRRTADNQFYR